MNDEGRLVVGTRNGDVVYPKPVTWQERDENRIPVDVAYRVKGDGYGFVLGSYDPALPVLTVMVMGRL